MESPRHQQTHQMPADKPACAEYEHDAAVRVDMVLRRAAISGTCASLVSSGVMALAGVRDCASAVAPINAVSHWIWAERAFGRHDFSVAHTVTGYVIHHAMSVLWATGYEGYLAWRRPAASTAHAMMVGTAVAAIAALVDLRLTPERLTPGFERKLRPGALFALYAGFGLALSAGRLLQYLLTARERHRPPTRHAQ